jgi:hypothetical protein
MPAVGGRTPAAPFRLTQNRPDFPHLAYGSRRRLAVHAAALPDVPTYTRAAAAATRSCGIAAGRGSAPAAPRWLRHGLPRQGSRPAAVPCSTAAGVGQRGSDSVVESLVDGGFVRGLDRLCRDRPPAFPARGTKRGAGGRTLGEPPFGRRRSVGLFDTGVQIPRQLGPWWATTTPCLIGRNGKTVRGETPTRAAICSTVAPPQPRPRNEAEAGSSISPRPPGASGQGAAADRP